MGLQQIRIIERSVMNKLRVIIDLRIKCMIYFSCRWVLVPDTNYQVDYLHGRVAILRNAFWSEISAEDRIYPSNYWIRASYFHAWHEKNITPTIPSEIQEIVNFFAAQDLFKRTVSKSYMTGLNDFNPKKMQISEDDIMERLDQYRPLHVGMSPYNKQFIS